MGGHRVENTEQAGFNWGLLLALVLSVEVWVVAPSFLLYQV